VGHVGSHYMVSLREARRQNKGLRLKLHVQPSELSVLPWEFLYDPSRDYLCLSTMTPLVRYLNLPLPVEQLAVTPPLRILGMVASPQGLPQLDVGHEKRLMEEAIKGPRAEGLVELTWVQGQSWRDLQRAMRRGPWHVFHFIGHGGFDLETEEGAIVLSDEEGRKQLLGASRLARLLDDHHFLRLAFLNSCEGAKGSERDAFSSTAAALVRCGIPAVVAMQYEVTDVAAIEFSRNFYEAVAEGLPMDAAVAEARTGVNMVSTLEWGTPVLYMRSPDGRIFDISNEDVFAAVQSVEPTSEETEDRQEEGLLIRYRECVELVWADEQLNRREAEWLREFANNKLGLSRSAAADIEREVMGDTKEAILEHWERTTREEPRKVHPKVKESSSILSTVQVPDLAGLKRDEARSMLTAAGLKPSDQIKAHDDGVPEGRIVEQHPKAGAKVEQGSFVSITVSSGPQKAAAPSLSSQSTIETEQAEPSPSHSEARDRYSLPSYTGQDKQPSPPHTTPSGSASTHDQNGEKQRSEVSHRRAIVALLIVLTMGISGSIGWYFLGTPSNAVTVPDLRGEHVGAASRIVGSDFEIVRGQTVNTDEQSSNVIVSQDPAPNERVSEGSEIVVDVSSG
jgi:beta-lactam-binding protein with PASTA domain